MEAVSLCIIAISCSVVYYLANSAIMDHIDNDLAFAMTTLLDKKLDETNVAWLIRTFEMKKMEFVPNVNCVERSKVKIYFWHNIHRKMCSQQITARNVTKLLQRMDRLAIAYAKPMATKIQREFLQICLSETDLSFSLPPELFQICFEYRFV